MTRVLRGSEGALHYGETTSGQSSTAFKRVVGYNDDSPVIAISEAPAGLRTDEIGPMQH